MIKKGLVASIRPLRVEELAEIFATTFDTAQSHGGLKILKILCFPHVPL
jgi:hypothetical protein